MLHDITTTTDDSTVPLVTFPELDSGFSKLPAGAADARLTACLSRLQTLPVNEACPTWVARLGRTVSVLLEHAGHHSTEVLGTLTGRLAHWTMDCFLDTDAVAAELLVTLAQHGPGSLAQAGGIIVKRLAKGLSQQKALPAWTATLIGLLRQATSDPEAAATLKTIRSLLPDWRVVLSEEAFSQALANNKREDLLMLAGHFSLLSLVDVNLETGRPLGHALPPDGPALAIARDMQGVVDQYVANETIRLHWLLTPSGTGSIDKLLSQVGILFAAPACQRIRQEIVLSLARYAAIEQTAFRGAEATLLVCQLLHLLEGAPGGATPDNWAPVWTAVRQLSCMAQSNPSRARPDTDRSRTVNALLSPAGLTGQLEGVSWRLAMLKQRGLPVTDCLARLVQQVPCNPNGLPLVARVLQSTCANAQEHQQALLELCRHLDLPLHAGAKVYTKHLLHRAGLMALIATRENKSERVGETAILQQVAAQFSPGPLVLGLLSHAHAELQCPDFSAADAQWLAAQAQASVQALPAGVPGDWALQICSAFDDDMKLDLAPADYQQWSAWLRSL
jgi:hypothetical protein